MNSKRILYLDILKIISCIAVVMIHVTADGFKYINIHSISWSVITIFNVIVRFAVPIFVMVSGALFLNPDKKVYVKELWKKNILSLITIYIIWTLIYAVYKVYNKGLDMSIINILGSAVKKSYYHLWFIPMLIGIYACIPLLKPIVNSGKKVTEYFIIIFALFYIIPKTIELFEFPYYKYITAILNRMQIPMLGYICYFVLGHYLHTYELTKKQKKIIYIAGSLATVIGIVGTMVYSWHIDKAVVTLADNFSITTFTMSITVFVLIKSLFENKKMKFEKLIIHLSNTSLGIYLIHVLIKEILRNQLDMPFTNIWNLPLNMVIMLVGSYLISFGLSKIPVINKYIV